MAVGSCADDYDTMAESVNDKVFFAGEATCRHHPATMHGALLSGHRAAAQVEIFECFTNIILLSVAFIAFS